MCVCGGVVQDRVVYQTLNTLRAGDGRLGNATVFNFSSRVLTARQMQRLWLLLFSYLCLVCHDRLCFLPVHSFRILFLSSPMFVFISLLTSFYLPGFPASSAVVSSLFHLALPFYTKTNRTKKNIYSVFIYFFAKNNMATKTTLFTWNRIKILLLITKVFPSSQSYEHCFPSSSWRKVEGQKGMKINWFKKEGKREGKKKREKRSGGPRVKNVLVCRLGLDVSGDIDGNSSWETNYIAGAALFPMCVCVCLHVGLQTYKQPCNKPTITRTECLKTLLTSE